MTSTDFAAAQQRISQRRQQRLAAQEARSLQQKENLSSSTLLSHLPPSLRDLSSSVLVHATPIFGRRGTNPTFRVGQVDAELLDEELLELFKGQVGEALKYYGAHLRDDWNNEILLALRSIVFKLTIWDHDSSYGAALQNLRYTDARDTSLTVALPKKWQKALHGLFSVGGRYAWRKWEDYLLDTESSYDYEPSPKLQLLSRLSTLASTTHSVAAFASFLVFLVNGRYRTILDRVLRLRLVPTTSQVSREVSFEYLNRQLVWHAFTEFLLFLLPLVGISRWRRWLARAWRKAKAVLSRRSAADDAEQDARSDGELGFLPERTCAICYQDQNPTSTSENEVAAISAAATTGVVGSAQTDVTNPYEGIPCGCIYCFVCLAQRLEGEDGEGWVCLRCGEVIKECRPWSGDVLVLEEKKVAKRVSFAEDRIDKDDEKDLKPLAPAPVESETLSGITSSNINGNSHKLASASLDESAEWARPDAVVDDGEVSADTVEESFLEPDRSFADDDETASLAFLDGEDEEEEEADQ